MLMNQELNEQATGGGDRISVALMLALAMYFFGAVFLFSPVSAFTKGGSSTKRVQQIEPVPCGFAVTGQVDTSWICH